MVPERVGDEHYVGDDALNALRGLGRPESKGTDGENKLIRDGRDDRRRHLGGIERSGMEGIE